MTRSVMALTGCLFLAFAPVRFSRGATAVRLDDGNGNVVVVNDQGVGDNDVLEGSVSFVGPLGAGAWAVNVTTGLGSPILGEANLPVIHLNSVNVNSLTPGSLSLAITQTANKQTLGSLPFEFAVGGVVGGTLEATAYANSDNLPFSTGGPGAVQLGSTLGPFLATDSPSFSGSTMGSGADATSGSEFYSVTIASQIEHTLAGQSTTFDADLRAVPEPTSLLATSLFMSLGLLLLARCGREWHAETRSSRGNERRNLVEQFCDHCASA